MVTSPLKHADILERLADHVLAKGLSASSLRPLAAAAGTSDRMLLYYFKDKEALIAAILARIVSRLQDEMQRWTGSGRRPLEDLQRDLAAVMLSPELWPYMSLWLEIASLAARGDPFYRELGGRIGRGFLAWGADQLDSVTSEANEADAARLLVTIEGMVLLKSLGLEAVCRDAF